MTAASSSTTVSAGEAEARETSDSDTGTPTSPASDDDVIDAELVDTRSLADVLPHDISAAKALTTARRFAAEFGVEPPTALEQVTDYRLTARVLDALGCTEHVG